MFRGCFSYGKQSPCHIQEDETDEEKKEAKEWIKQKNKELEAECKLAWEMETAMQRLKITRIVCGTKSKWNWSM